MDTKVLDLFLQLHTIKSVISFYFIRMYCHLCAVLKIQPNNSGRYAACVCFSTLHGFSLSLEQYQCNRKFLTCIMDGDYEGSFFLMKRDWFFLSDSEPVEQLDPFPSIKI